MDEKYMSSVFKEWIKNHETKDYQIIENNQDCIELNTDYGKAEIHFTDVTEGTIVEFNIVSYKDQEVKFYLHFELNDEDYAHQLYDEMVETLIELKNKKTLKVLLSCSSGLTTSMFASNLNSVVEMLGEDYHFEAVAYTNIYEEVENYDVILIAPQIGYLLKRLKESLPDKLVLQIPTAIFAGYDAIGAIKFIQNEIDQFQKEKKEKQEIKCHCCKHYNRRILSIVLSANRAQTRIYYRIYDNNDIMDQQIIIKPTLNTNDLYDVIDTVLLKVKHLDAIAIAIPGIIKENDHLRSSIDGKDIDLKNELEKKYHIDVVISNNANAAVVGFSLEHSEYKNIIFHSQPFGFGVGGQGILVNGQVVLGKEGIAGEIRFFLRRMQLSDDCEKLAWHQTGVKELVIKSLLPVISIIGPEAIALFSPMTPDKEEIKEGLLSFIPQEFLPEIYIIKESWYYMLDGITKLCLDDLNENEQV